MTTTTSQQSRRPKPPIVAKALRMVAASGVRLDRTPDYQRGLPKGRVLADGSTEYASSDGVYVVPPSSEGDVIAMHIARGLVFEREVLDACRPYIPRDGVVLDVGANLGQMSIQFSRLVGPEGLVASFEAQPFLVPYLDKNLKANTASRSQLVFGAVGDIEGGFVHFPRPDLRDHGSYGSYNIPTDGSGDDDDLVPRITIDSWACDLDRVDFLKIDVQGYDLSRAPWIGNHGGQVPAGDRLRVRAAVPV